mmetsp:Transcript_22633/g.34454  ORF Transcript_22633/g.34454 Transcript_22633/m.34454 type:complete len:678 (+) Transcript_22633:112-2145(+)|eukprot:CAMPEP_0117036852 /NCGR_PEP_ID=MMETSP0472-20121206/26067_1 /TAXON_ID=693140 ORGANISM="Tiarina fusus, Strain LIS" /NCGR_SAMPLE_ID=MMETSP0472 /ASSEMBLY_ACC=CAM_ASM_000603 /LENGTH=677 /DNA_ID=CAMNT_0004746705 /DNA_START=105 /DNA_END=2138 /DNA_ORIENTATION=+
MRELSTSNAIESALATLQPLRDLSRNWDVDIASCLEEYLQELTVTLDDDGGEKRQEQGENATPNFAHAALILQNSSNVYSRKVEYLHSLVYKALYEFFRSTNGKETSSSRRKSTDAAIEEFYDFDPHNDFLLLDDVVPEDFTSKKINLKDDDDEEGKSLPGSTPNQSMMTLNRTRLSLGGLSVTRAERTSLGGGGFNPSSSSQQRALLGTLNDGALRLVNGKCDVGADGLLLLPGSSLSGPSNNALLDPSDGRRSLFGDEMMMAAPAEAGQADQHDFVAQGDGDDDHDNDGPGFEMNDDYDEEPMEAAHQDNASVVEATVGQHQVQQEEPTRRVAFAENTKKKKADPWAMLDPHSSDQQVNRPLRTGKTYKLPPGVDLPPSDCVTGASTKRMPTRRRLEPLPEIQPCLAVQSFRAFLKNTGDPPNIPFNGLVFGDEFAYIAKATAKKKAAEQRQARKAKLESEHPNAVYEEDPYEDDNDHGGGGFDFGGEDDDDDDQEDDNNGMGNVGMSSLDEAFESAAGGTNLGNTFEELCRAHIQAFAKGADDFALNTQLSERVNKWQAKLSPILEAEERRATFDIHQYSQKLLETAEEGLQNTKRLSGGSMTPEMSKIEFEDVTVGCTQSDVCRFFLASLSLANAGNIKIEESSSDVYRFDVIRSDVARPMETYRAPSLIEEA